MKFIFSSKKFQYAFAFILFMALVSNTLQHKNTKYNEDSRNNIADEFKPVDKDFRPDFFGKNYEGHDRPNEPKPFNWEPRKNHRNNEPQKVEDFKKDFEPKRSGHPPRPRGEKEGDQRHWQNFGDFTKKFPRDQNDKQDFIPRKRHHKHDEDFQGKNSNPREFDDRKNKHGRKKNDAFDPVEPYSEKKQFISDSKICKGNHVLINGDCVHVMDAGMITGLALIISCIIAVLMFGLLIILFCWILRRCRRKFKFLKFRKFRNCNNADVPAAIDNSNNSSDISHQGFINSNENVINNLNNPNSNTNQYINNNSIQNRCNPFLNYSRSDNNNDFSRQLTLDKNQKSCRNENVNNNINNNFNSNEEGFLNKQLNGILRYFPSLLKKNENASYHKLIEENKNNINNQNDAQNKIVNLNNNNFSKKVELITINSNDELKNNLGNKNIDIIQTSEAKEELIPENTGGLEQNHIVIKGNPNTLSFLNANKQMAKNNLDKSRYINPASFNRHFTMDCNNWSLHNQNHMPSINLNNDGIKQRFEEIPNKFANQVAYHHNNTYDYPSFEKIEAEHIDN